MNTSELIEKLLKLDQNNGASVLIQATYGEERVKLVAIEDVEIVGTDDGLVNCVTITVDEM